MLLSSSVASLDSLCPVTVKNVTTGYTSIMASAQSWRGSEPCFCAMLFPLSVLESANFTWEMASLIFERNFHLVSWRPLPEASSVTSWAVRQMALQMIWLAWIPISILAAASSTSSHFWPPLSESVSELFSY